MAGRSHGDRPIQVPCWLDAVSIGPVTGRRTPDVIETGDRKFDRACAIRTADLSVHGRLDATTRAMLRELVLDHDVTLHHRELTAEPRQRTPEEHRLIAWRMRALARKLGKPSRAQVLVALEQLALDDPEPGVRTKCTRVACDITRGAHDLGVFARDLAGANATRLGEVITWLRDDALACASDAAGHVVKRDAHSVARPMLALANIVDNTTTPSGVRDEAMAALLDAAPPALWLERVFVRGHGFLDAWRDGIVHRLVPRLLGGRATDVTPAVCEALAEACFEPDIDEATCRTILERLASAPSTAAIGAWRTLSGHPVTLIAGRAGVHVLHDGIAAGRIAQLVPRLLRRLATRSDTIDMTHPWGQDLGIAVLLDGPDGVHQAPLYARLRASASTRLQTAIGERCDDDRRHAATCTLLGSVAGLEALGLLSPLTRGLFRNRKTKVLAQEAIDKISARHPIDHRRGGLSESDPAASGLSIVPRGPERS